MPDDDEPSPENPNAFPSEPQVAPLDEAPNGRTPMDSNGPSPDSLPPGAAAQDDEEARAEDDAAS